MTTKTMDRQLANEGRAECDEPSDVWIDMLVVGGFALVRHLPTLLDFVSSAIAQIMGNGYEVHVKKGDFELRFGKDRNLIETNGPEAHFAKV